MSIQRAAEDSPLWQGVLCLKGSVVEVSQKRTGLHKKEQTKANKTTINEAEQQKAAVGKKQYHSVELMKLN